VLHSYDAAGGRHTNGVLMASKKFYDANPKVCAAVVAALEEANAWIKANPRKAAEIYIAMAKEKRSTLDEMEKMVTDPDVDYTTTPINVMKFVEFMNLAGTVKKKPASWKDLFFPIAYEKPGASTAVIPEAAKAGAGTHRCKQDSLLMDPGSRYAASGMTE
jgi:NitT/TauT family transport system substrate-binding protein